MERNEVDSFQFYIRKNIGIVACGGYIQLCEHIHKLSEFLKVVDNRNSLGMDVLEDLGNLLAKVASQLQSESNHTGGHLESADENKIDHSLSVATGIFRCFRNACANCPTKQRNVARIPSLWQNTNSVLSSCLELIKIDGSQWNSAAKVTCRCGVQFLGNTVGGCEENQNTVWSNFTDLFCPLLESADDKLITYTWMVMYNCLSCDIISQLLEAPSCHHLCSVVLDNLAQHENEWGLYIIETLLIKSPLLIKVYNDLSDANRNMLLDILAVQLSRLMEKQLPDKRLVSNMTPSQRPHTENIHFISEEFKDKAHAILGLYRSDALDEVESILVGKLLDILCWTTSATSIYPALFQDIALIKCALNLLHCMNMVGENGENCFSNLSKLSEAGHTDARDHPVFGLKRDLIRLIGNLTFKNKPMQDQVRELGGIQLILNHTNIDCRNPFITQWSIFAIRNLCEENPANQAVIANMHLEGVADQLSLLRDFGVDARLEGDKIVIEQLNRSELETKSPFSKN